MTDRRIDGCISNIPIVFFCFFFSKRRDNKCIKLSSAIVLISALTVCSRPIFQFSLLNHTL